jgi:hypothetical protein
MVRLAFIVPVVMVVSVTAHAQSVPADAAAPHAVAIVAATRGESIVLGPAGGARPVRLFDRLPAGRLLETRRGADVVVIHRSGTRTRVLEASRVRIEPAGVTTLAGGVETLTPVPTVPLVAPVWGANATITAVRIRAGGIDGLHPARGEATVAGATVLEFRRATTERYEVEVEAPDATIAFRTHTTDTRVSVPAATLAPGRAYRWRVTAKMPTGFDVVGEGAFRTLTDEDGRARASIRSALIGAGSEHLALLAEIDWTLGLWRDALAGFRAARAAGATDAVIQSRIAEIERRLAGPDGAAPRR